MSETKEPKGVYTGRPRVPKNADSILAGAMKLPLQSQIEICKQLHLSIEAQVGDLKAKAEQAIKLSDALNGK